MRPKANNMCRWRNDVQQKPRRDRGRDGRDTATSPGAPGAPGRRERQGGASSVSRTGEDEAFCVKRPPWPAPLG